VKLSRRSKLLCVALACALGLLLAPLASGAAAKTCGGKKVTIMGTPGPDHIVGKKASDVIYGGGGDDVISGGPNGNDTICGGPGDDVIKGGRGYDSLYGEGGDDDLDGETGSDMLDGGSGEDELSGEKGGDTEHGGAGDDKLMGAKGPDKLEGGSGNDWIDGEQGSDDVEGGSGEDELLGDKGNDDILGGSGDDRIEGGPGNGDVVRGDAGTDVLSGGPGTEDIVSYASATRGGVIVNLEADRAKGDGHDKLSGFEDVVGSPQGDTIMGDGSMNRLDGGVGDDDLMAGGGGGEALGGPGNDECTGFNVENSCGPEEGAPAGAASVIVNIGLDGSSLVVQGGEGPDDIHIGLTDAGWTVTDSVPLFGGGGCVNPVGQLDTVVCPGERGLALITATGGGGGDELVVDQSVPDSAKVRMNGSAGSDTLIGGNGDDVLESGENYNSPDDGHDTLIGSGGSDVLYADPGADQLEGGPGNDLLVSAVPVCQGNTYDGGPGEDTVSYARSDAPLRVELGGTGGPAGCGNLDRVLGDNESLEGSDGPDVLIGDNGDNSLMGHLGADTFVGKGGDDFIEALDGARDKQIDCGPGDDEAVTDPKDPKPNSC
jgi:Ca2+-binding RTX toxin-like protein